MVTVITWMQSTRSFNILRSEIKDLASIFIYQMLRNSFTGLFIAFASVLYGQSQSDLPTIVSDRPGISDSPELVPTKALQIESGLNYDYQNTLNIQNRKLTYNSLLIRFRIANNLELRMQNEYCKYQSQNLISGDNVTMNGMSPSSIGYKIKVSEAKGFAPSLSLIGSFILPYTARKTMRPAYIGANIKFAAFNAISDKIGLTYNLGAA